MDSSSPSWLNHRLSRARHFAEAAKDRPKACPVLYVLDVSADPAPLSHRDYNGKAIRRGLALAKERLAFAHAAQGETLLWWPRAMQLDKTFPPAIISSSALHSSSMPGPQVCGQLRLPRLKRQKQYGEGFPLSKKASRLCARCARRKNDARMSLLRAIAMKDLSTHRIWRKAGRILGSAMRLAYDGCD